MEMQRKKEKKERGKEKQWEAVKVKKGGGQKKAPD